MKARDRKKTAKPSRRYRRASASNRKGGSAAPVIAMARQRVSRRSPEVARQEILDAAVAILLERPFRELTIPLLMSRTQIGRSAFYAYFKDIYAVAEAIARGLQERALVYYESWSATNLQPVDAIRKFVSDMVGIWVANGPMMAAMIDAAASDHRLEQVIDEILAVFERRITELLVQEHAAGRVPAGDFDELAAALVLANQAYLKARLGRPGKADPVRVTKTLQTIWIGAFYGGGLPPRLTAT